ncbi:hypothetical protein OG379_00755 [Streptomyces sp. NBC_01166]|uniref:hypothetical protein n=1 Tax=Streptomyces sp. NBC_01166 TaxID=2903755 RepID=UPI0038638087|nr:hypothetical protein OG379_00755 [Streptomyces sp. NBC_01166]
MRASRNASSSSSSIASAYFHDRYAKISPQVICSGLLALSVGRRVGDGDPELPRQTSHRCWRRGEDIIGNEPSHPCFSWNAARWGPNGQLGGAPSARAGAYEMAAACSDHEGSSPVPVLPISAD